MHVRSTVSLLSVRAGSGLIFFCVTMMSALTPASQAFAHSGHINWKNWSFDWRVNNSAGLALEQLRWKGTLVLYRGSLPVIRVKYDCGDCGPYADQIHWDLLVDIGGDCGGVKLCKREFVQNGTTWLEVAVYARIGSYHIYQGWYLSETGVINPFVFSKGLQHNSNHVHHTYWRLDFDLNGFPDDRIFEHNDGQPMTEYVTERNAVKDTPKNRIWYVVDSDKTFGKAVWIYPRMPNDGSSDGFSTKDVAGRLYHAGEGEPWPFGATGHLGYDNDESISKKDDVFWYVAHLAHNASDAGFVWHVAGPAIELWNY